jgi:hypothetical protein
MVDTLRPTTTFFYMQEVPQKDGWKTDFQYASSTNLLASRVLAIRSSGRNSAFEGETYTVGPFVATDYDQDMVVGRLLRSLAGGRRRRWWRHLNWPGLL